MLESADGKLCKELLRFLHSIDESGTSLRQAISEMDNPTDLDEPPAKLESASNFDPPANTSSTRVLALSNDFIPSNPIGPAPSESPRRSHQIHFRHPSAPSPSTSSTTTSPVVNRDQAITSPFELTSPRQAMYMTPPSPMTVYPNQSQGEGEGEGKMPMALGDFIEEEETEGVEG
jgi:hypothetical protein